MIIETQFKLNKEKQIALINREDKKIIKCKLNNNNSINCKINKLESKYLCLLNQIKLQLINSTRKQELANIKRSK